MGSKLGFDTMARISPVVGSVTTAEARTPSGSASYARRCSSGSIVSSTWSPSGVAPVMISMARSTNWDVGVPESCSFMAASSPSVP